MTRAIGGKYKNVNDVHGLIRSFYLSAGSLFFFRYGDGAVRLFDARLPPDRNAVASWHEHQAWVVNTHLSGHYGAVSASADGSIDFFDLRASGAVRA